MFPKLSRCEDANREPGGRFQDVRIAGHQNIGVSCRCGCHDPFVVVVPQRQFEVPARLGDQIVIAKQALDIGDNSRGPFDALQQSALELHQHDFTDE